MVQFLEKEHKNFEKILYKSMAFENCANFLKATNMLIGRNPKNDFRVKHPFINQEFHVMISELDKCAERKQSFSFFNVKELVPSVHIQARPEIPYLWTLVLQPFRKMAQEFTAVHKDIFNMKTTRRRIKERIQRKLFTQDWFPQKIFYWIGKMKCVFPIVISTEFRMMQYRDDDHRKTHPTLLDKINQGYGRAWRGTRRRNVFRKQPNITFVFGILYNPRRSWNIEAVANI